MGLKITRLADRKPKGQGVVAKKRLYLTADRQRVVEYGDPDARFLLAAEGRTIPEDEARRLGLLKEAAKAEDKELKKAENKTARKRKARK